MASVAVNSNFQKYLSSNTNEFFHKANYWGGVFDDGIFKLLQHGAGLGQQISKLTGNSDAQQKCSNVVAGFAAGRDAISAVRFIPAFHKAASGQIFWQTDSSGFRKVAQDQNSNPIRIPREDLNLVWRKVEKDGQKVWENRNTGSISTDGKYIEDPQGKAIARDWMDIVMDILILVARALSPIRFLHSLKAIDLGKHAKAMGGVVMAIWSTVLTLNFVQAIRDLLDEADVESIKKRVWDVWQGFIELLAIIFDFGVGSAHPVLACVGAGVNIVCAGSMLFKEAVNY
jgi:hypothetical protein